jgi:hypothetical protein
MDGPIVAELKGFPTLSIKAFDVIEGLSKVTRAPLAEAQKV